MIGKCITAFKIGTDIKDLRRDRDSGTRIIKSSLSKGKLLTHLTMSHEKYTSCIDACSTCAIECSHCESACLEEQNVKMLAHCIKLNHDCAAICFLAMEAMASGSEFARQICGLCAEICTACAEECERHSHEHCKKCAKECRNCAVECGKIAKV